jgi:phage tail-like protein
MRSAEIARLLPEVFQSALRPAGGAVEADRRTAATLEAMALLHAPCEEILDGLDRFFRPQTAPERFAPYLARWVDLDWLLRPGPSSDASADSLASGIAPLRELVRAASEIAQWRGTARGLVGFLDTVTGVPGFVVDEAVVDPSGAPLPFHFRVVGPADAKRFQPLIERVIVAEKPAYMTWELAFAST